MVRYKVKPNRVDENERLVRAVYEQLHRERPNGLRYATFKLEPEDGKLDDGVSFVHVVSHESDGDNPLAELAAFKAFVAEIQDRCTEPPVRSELSEVGSYAFFAS
jgi:hypothetical protein